MARKTKDTPKLEGEVLLERLGQMALERLASPFSHSRQEKKQGSHNCGFRFQDEVLVATLSWETVQTDQHIRLEVFSINPQSGDLNLRLAHDFKEDL